MLNNFVEISQIQSPPRTRLKLLPALLLKAGFGMSAFGRLPDRSYMQWVFDVNGVAENMRGALDHMKGPADLVLEAQAQKSKLAEHIQNERRRRVLEHLRRAARSQPPSQVLYADESVLRSRA